MILKKSPNLAAMGASILFINAYNPFRVLNSERVAFKKDTADSGTTCDRRTQSYAPKKENNRRIWALCFCGQFLYYYFQTSYICALEIERK
ncbi:hypothetical protein SAMN04488131_1195 [Flavobacterium xueshanense]|uniref:Uncharacterized protein n=1 Tax=Flavobacterium xueshanense TaxID=935223 RepID=A0A1I2IC46_9FLAO|nr:hypothetical protein SAMN04488131_1195 [Flavobacterium xueshanense]